MSPRPLLRGAAALAAAALVVTGCGSDDDTDSSAGGSTGGGIRHRQRGIALSYLFGHGELFLANEPFQTTLS